jgi:outer membrane protein
MPLIMRTPELFKNVIKISSCIILLTFCDSISAQVQKDYNPHEVIEIGNGTKIEVLKCRGEGADQECDVIYYTDKRQAGKRKWEKTSLIRELEQSAKVAAQQQKQEVTFSEQHKGAANNAKPAIKSGVVKTPATSNTSATNNKLQLQTQTKPAVTKEQISIVRPQPEPKQNGLEAALPDSVITAITPVEKNASISSVNVTRATYNLEECYRLALDNNITLKRAQNTINSNVIDRETARFGMYPSLSYNIGHYFSFGKNIDPVTNTYVLETFSGGYTTLGLQLNLFSGFSRVNTIKQTAYIIQSSEYTKKRLELELLANITLIYARLLVDKEQLKSGRSNIQSTLNELDIINEKIKVGRLTKYEYYTFNARLNSQQADLVTLQNDSLGALQDLKQLVNFRYNQQIDIAPIDTTVLARLFNTNISATDYINSVLQSHPAIKQAQLDEQVAALGVKIAKSNALPSVSVGGNVASTYNINQVTANGEKIGLSNQLNNNLGQNINISLHVPIFSQMETANRVKKERINISNAQLARSEAINTITTSTLQLINDFNAAKQKYKASLSAWEQNSLSYNMYQEKYRLGQVSSVELLTAADILYTSTSKYLQAKLEMFFRYQLLELLKSQT